VAKALQRDLTVLPAIELRAADLAASGEREQAAQLFRLSDRLSRRSLPTRLWLVQHAVDRGDVAGALHNFDIALRTTTDAQPILFPVLATASADPTLTTPLARTLDRPSDWRLMFFEWALANDANVTSIAKVTADMRDRGFIVGNGVDQRLIERLVTNRDFGAAMLLDRKFGRGARGLVADPSFTDASARYPFGWGLVSGGSLAAERASSGLAYRADPAVSGQVAAQLLGLAPGRYALVTKSATAASGAAPYWSITCGEVDGSELAQLDQPDVANREAATPFVVPPGCAAQWLTLRVRTAPEAVPQSGTISWVSVRPFST
jgi:hypothetical protein